MANEIKEDHVHKIVYSSTFKIIYTFFMAALIALFFGLGVSAFYPAPKAPEYPNVLTTPKKTEAEAQAPQVLEAQQKYDQEQKDFMVKNAAYSRNVSIITLACAILSLVVSLILINRILILSDGLMLGGLFTLVYSIVRGFMTEDARYRFVLVAVGLLITLGLGYIKFIKPNEEKAE